MLIAWNTIQQMASNITGIIHAGAHTGEESKDYKSIPTKWIEADPDLIPMLSAKFPGGVYHFAACSFDGEIQLNKMPFKAANSVLQPNLNKRRSDVYVEEVITVPARQIKHIQDDKYNFIAMDIQGNELDALYGCDLSIVDYLLLELHKVETYKNVPLIEDIDKYLTPLGFDRKITKWTRWEWGEGLYVKIS